MYTPLHDLDSITVFTCAAVKHSEILCDSVPVTIVAQFCTVLYSQKVFCSFVQCSSVASLWCLCACGENRTWKAVDKQFLQPMSSTCQNLTHHYADQQLVGSKSGVDSTENRNLFTCEMSIFRKGWHFGMMRLLVYCGFKRNWAGATWVALCN